MDIDLKLEIYTFIIMHSWNVVAQKMNESRKKHTKLF